MNDTISISQPTPVDHDPFSGFTRQEFAVTKAQAALWDFAHSGLAQASCTQVESASIRLDGQVKREALEAALQLLTQFHEALRGHYSEDGRRFVLEPSLEVPVASQDLSGLPASNRVHALTEMIAVDSVTAFDLVRGPLFRCLLVQLRPESTVVVLTAHLAVCDGWSLDVLIADLARLYSALVGKAPLPVPPQHGFSDFVAYMASTEGATREKQSLEYWKSRLSNPPVKAVSGANGVSELRAIYVERALDTTLLKELRAVARTHNFSLFTLLLGVVAIQESRARGPEPIIGVPFAGQPLLEMESCVGALASAVPLRVNCEPEVSFSTFCHTISAAVMDARDQAFVTLEEIEKVLGASGVNASPLVRTTLTHVQKFAPDKLVFADLKNDYQLNPRSAESGELNLVAFESGSALLLRLQGRAHTYTKERLERWLLDVELALAEIRSNPTASLAQVVEAIKRGAAGGKHPALGFTLPHGRLFAVEQLDELAAAPTGASGTGATGAFSSPSSLPRAGSKPPSAGEPPIIVTLRAGRAGVTPILCLFGIQLYVDLALACDADTPVIGIHVPMLYVPGKTPRPSLPDVVARYVQAVRSVQPSGPYRLAGLCYGGVTAFEVARALRAQGEEVVQVAIFDSVLSRGVTVDYKLRASLLARRGLQDPVGAARLLVNGGKAYGLQVLLRSPMRRPAELVLARATASRDEQPIDLQVTGYESEADVAQFEATNPYLDAPIIVFRATNADTRAWRQSAPHMGWEGLARLVEAHDVASDHMSIVRPPYAKQVAAAMAQQFLRLTRG